MCSHDLAVAAAETNELAQRMVSSGGVDEAFDNIGMHVDSFDDLLGVGDEEDTEDEAEGNDEEGVGRNRRTVRSGSIATDLSTQRSSVRIHL